MSREFSTPKKPLSSLNPASFSADFKHQSLKKYPKNRQPNPNGKIKARKSLGQNFLEDKNIINKIIAGADINKSDTILEIGPGLGALTLPLAYHSKKVVAVEKDSQLVKKLKETIQPLQLKNIEIIQADILKELNQGRKGQSLKKIKQPYKVVANIPYYITAPLIRKILETNPQPEKIILMVQKEVAQRIVAMPPKMNLLAIGVGYYANPKILFYVSKNCFWPKPKVDSAVISLTPYRQFKSIDKNFFKVVKAGFACPRKQILNNLTTGLNLEKQKLKNQLLKAGLNPMARPENLSLSDWENLVSLLFNK